MLLQAKKIINTSMTIFKKEKQMNLFTKVAFLLVFVVYSISSAQAVRYVLVEASDTLIGEVIRVKADQSETLLDIARRNGFGYQDMKLVNPDVNIWLPNDGEEITLPAQFILPVAPMEGIVLNVPEMRLYYYPPKVKNKSQEVITYPLGIGREGWNTPYMKTKVIEKKVRPNWYPPESIRKEHNAAGDFLPKIVKAGVDNPLGAFAMRLGNPNYLIHGTNKPYGIGMRVSHGCIRLYPEDIEALFSEVTLKTPVNIINQPYKIGIKNNIIYLEAHPFLDEDVDKYENNLTSVVALIIDVSKDKEYELDWTAAFDAINKPTGLPIAVGRLLR
ncbi:MAG: peptigoglycan-binding protein LysM [Legionellales bacterium]|nr:peptigoglycan-binding protein LysM [Legionellales bacterium]|tara:strand:- start:94 stop:1086 length:993 start_codon:yes stop_codon:yes gene_type:complete